jgi:hypothetical protein
LKVKILTNTIFCFFFSKHFNLIVIEKFFSQYDDSKEINIDDPIDKTKFDDVGEDEDDDDELSDDYDDDENAPEFDDDFSHRYVKT